MRHLPEFWTPEPIVAWKVVTHGSGGYEAAYMRSPIDISNPKEPARCELVAGMINMSTGEWMPTPHNVPAPAADCTCGWYAFKERSDATDWAALMEESTLRWYVKRKMIAVETWQVEMSGVVIEHERGYRSQYIHWIERVA